MHEEPPSELVAAMVGAIDGRPLAQTDVILAALVRGAWPGGVSDRAEPSALEWVRRWGPAGTTPQYLDACSCAEGRCAVCN